MQVLVTFRNMESTDALKDYAKNKLQKIKKYVDEPLKAEVVLRVEKFRHIAEITVSANRSTLVSNAETEDMYSALDLVVDKLERQAQKHKSKLKNHHGSETKEQVINKLAGTEEEFDDEEETGD